MSLKVQAGAPLDRRPPGNLQVPPQPDRAELSSHRTRALLHPGPEEPARTSRHHRVPPKLHQLGMRVLAPKRLVLIGGSGLSLAEALGCSPRVLAASAVDSKTFAGLSSDSE